MNKKDYEVAVVGAGPAGSTAAIYLAQKGFSVCLIEKKEFPREVLCGEFLSREVLEILDDIGMKEAILHLQPNPISFFRYCPDHSRTFSAPLSFTGYGLKRGAFDLLLLNEAKRSGVTIYQPASVEEIIRNESGFDVTVRSGSEEKKIHTDRVIAAYGKFNILDRSLRANPTEHRSMLNGIKFHVPIHYLNDYPKDEIQMFTAEALYCGVNIVNDETATICFLERRSKDDLPPRMRLKELAAKNRHFRKAVSGEFISAIDTFPIFGTSNINFGRKSLVGNGVMMIGDAARVIAPLAGDGIGMAMQSGKIAAETFDEGRRNTLPHEEILRRYAQRWHSAFRRRLYTAGAVQKLFLSCPGKKMSILFLSKFPAILPEIIRYTRG